jgi:hypothetical protein
MRAWNSKEPEEPRQLRGLGGSRISQLRKTSETQDGGWEGDVSDLIPIWESISEERDDRCTPAPVGNL